MLQVHAGEAAALLALLVQILTQKCCSFLPAGVSSSSACPLVVSGSQDATIRVWCSVYSLYWYTSTNTEPQELRVRCSAT